MDKEDWVSGKWWRVLDHKNSLWCETSSEEEARAALLTCPELPATLENILTLTKVRWMIIEERIGQ